MNLPVYSFPFFRRRVELYYPQNVEGKWLSYPTQWKPPIIK